MSLVYLLTHNAAAMLSRRAKSEARERVVGRLQWLSKMFLRVLVTLWVATFGLQIVFALARHPSCILDEHGSLLINVGTICIVQRSSVGAGLLSL